MILYLVQHGDAVSKEVNPDRPLSEQGRRDVENMGRFLARAKLTVDAIFHSGKTRARQSTEILAGLMANEITVSEISGISPNDAVDEFSQQLPHLPPRSMLVGHLPFMAKLVSYLVAQSDEAPLVAYQPGTIVCLQKSDTDNWTINWMVRPELV